MNRKALGRGLGALIPTPESPAAEGGAETKGREKEGVGEHVVPLSRIRPNPLQPRTDFAEAALDDLARSIQENGLIQPLVVRKSADGFFELIAGERRFLACRKAGLAAVPVVIRTAARREMLELALVENLQRENLNPIEEAEAFQRLATEFGLTQDEIAGQVSKSRTAVTNSLRLLALEEDLRELVRSGKISAGHARGLLTIEEPARRRALAKEICEKGLSVRDVEARTQVQRSRQGRATARKRSHPALEAWEGRLRERFGTQVRIVGGIARGRVEIHYFSEEDLGRVLDLTGAGSEL